MCNLVISSDGLWSSSACDKKQTTLCFRGSVSRYPCPPTGTYCFIVYSIFIVVNVDTNRHVAGLHLISAPTLTPLLWPNKYTVWIRPPNSSQPLHQKLQSTDTVIIVDITTADALTWLFKLNTVHSFSEKMRFSSFGSALFASKLLEGGTTDRLIPVRRPHGLINGSALGLGSRRMSLQSVLVPLFKLYLCGIKVLLYQIFNRSFTLPGQSLTQLCVCWFVPDAYLSPCAVLMSCRRRQKRLQV